MRTKKKITIDVLLMIGMFFSMSFHLFGMGTHKLIGLLTFILFMIHNILNRRWYQALFKGRYNPMRLVHMLTNIIMLFAVIGIMVSGVMLSKEMAAGFEDVMTTGRILHNVSSYAGCIGIALHIGFHLRRKTKHDD